jgi:pimeloyl-ACP methyl ester carboxylesterase
MITDLTRRFTVDGVELAWDRFCTPGDQAPLLLCHGFSGSSHDFALHVEALASDREVIVLDHRGHGRSAKLRSEDRYSIGRLTDDLIALIDAEVGGPVDLLGHSMGGAIAMHLTQRRPDLVRSLIMMDTSAWSFRPLDPAMGELFTAFFASFDPASGLPDLSGMPQPEQVLIDAATPAEWQALKADMDTAFDPYAMKALGGDLFSGDVIDQRAGLEAVSMPVTVVVGELDEPFVSQAAELAAEVADGALAVIAGAYHSPQLTHPREWADAVRTHLNRGAA